MSHIAISHTGRPQAPARSSTGGVVAVVLAAWLALAVVLGARDAFVAPVGTPPVPLLIAATSPVLIFLAALWTSRAFREFILAADLPLLMGIQAWRFAGFGFLALYAYDVLPGSFAWPAGLGDMAIGVTAPLLMLALIRRPSFAASRTFVAWNVLGILDLVVAVSSGTLGTILSGSHAGVATMAPMTHLPLVLVPTYLVPTFVMLHLTALLQARRASAALTERA